MARFNHRAARVVKRAGIVDGILVDSTEYFSGDQSDATGRRPCWDRFYAKFRTRLRDYNYIEYRCGEQNVAIFLKSDIKPDPSLQPVP